MKKITALILILILLFTGTATFADDGEQMYCVSVDSFLASTPVHNGSTTAKYPGAAEAVVSAAKKSAAEVDLSSYKIRKEDISSFFKDIVDSEPLMFNVSRKIQCMLSSTGMLSKLVFDYTMTADEYKSALLLVEYTADNFMSQIKDGASDFEKALILHDRIAEAYHYDLTYKNDDIYSFITEGKGVCQAYTLLYKYLLDKSGIENAVSSSLTINHIWNLVKLNGKWYNVDVTWDDPLVSDSICDITGTVHHRYFLNSDALSESQGHENAMAKYACTDTRYDSKNYRNICSPFVRVSGKLYCFSGGICEYSPASDSVKTVYADNEKWPVWGNSLQYYTRDFSGLSLYNGTLIYNTATAVKAYSFAEKSAKAIHTPNTSNGYIYGSTLKGDTVIYSISKGGKKAVNEHSFKISDDTVKPKPDPDPSVKLPFTDVKNSHWFFDAVKYAYENGLMSGISKTVFAPNSTTSRAMLVKVLYNMEKPEGVYKTNPFKDVP